MYDRDATSLTVFGVGLEIGLQLDGHSFSTGREVRCDYAFTDDSQTVILAHELLERVLPVADCDEITEAVRQLRLLASRDAAMTEPSESWIDDPGR